MLVKEIYDIFKQEPIFQNAYMRFLYQDIKRNIDKGTYIYQDGVYLDYLVYKRKEEVKLNRIISKNKGKGNATKVILQFLSKFKNKDIILKVDKNNIKAINLYIKVGFILEKELDNFYLQYKKSQANI